MNKLIEPINFDSWELILLTFPSNNTINKYLIQIYKYINKLKYHNPMLYYGDVYGFSSFDDPINFTIMVKKIIKLL